MDENKIIAHFGADFYAKLVLDLEEYARLWDLSDFEQIDYYSVNCIFKCFSNKHGSCILKIGNPSRETYTEYHMLREYNGRGFCKVYQSDIANGVLLIERIIPGIQLRAEPSLDKRLDIFCGLWSRLHIKANDKTVYPTYMQWVSRITQYMRKINEHENLFRKMLRAEEICHSLCEKYPGEMLLHGDLHHDNILLDKNNGYLAIDPKGVVGDVVFDIPRFILNEFGDIIDDCLVNKIAYITQELSKKLHIPQYDIHRLLFVEICMANSWSVESSKIPNMEEVLFAEKLMDGTL